MTKTLKWLGGGIAAAMLLGLAGLFSGAVADAQGSPPSGPPHRFAGSVTLNGDPAAAGTAVTASVDGVECGSATVLTGAAGSTYAVDVPASCAEAGDTVHFTVGGYHAAETGTWAGGGRSDIDLTAASSMGDDMEECPDEMADDMAGDPAEPGDDQPAEPGADQPAEPGMSDDDMSDDDMSDDDMSDDDMSDDDMSDDDMSDDDMTDDDMTDDDMSDDDMTDDDMTDDDMTDDDMTEDDMSGDDMTDDCPTDDTDDPAEPGTGTDDPVEPGDTGTEDPVEPGDTGTEDPVEPGDTGTEDPVEPGDTDTDTDTDTDMEIEPGNTGNGLATGASVTASLAAILGVMTLAIVLGGYTVARRRR